MGNRQVSDIISDMISNRIEVRELFNIGRRSPKGLSQIEKTHRGKLNVTFGELQRELEFSLGALVHTVITSMRDTGEIR